MTNEHRQVASQIRETLSGSNAQAIQRLREFLSQPFFVAEPYTKRDGVSVSLKEAIRDVGEITDSHERVR